MTSLLVLSSTEARQTWQRVFAYARSSSSRRDCLRILGQTSSNAPKRSVQTPEGCDVPSGQGGVPGVEQADGGGEVRRARIAPFLCRHKQAVRQAGRQASNHSSECCRCNEAGARCEQLSCDVRGPWGAGVRLHRAWVARAEVVAGKAGREEAVEHGECMEAYLPPICNLDISIVIVVVSL